MLVAALRIIEGCANRLQINFVRQAEGSHLDFKYPTTLPLCAGNDGPLMMNKATQLAIPHTLLFDWHGTLVDTLDAMFAAMEDVLPQLEDLDLIKRLQPESACRNPDDCKLIRYIRIYRQLHPKILAERRVSRTDIFNAIFGDDREAKLLAHHAYNQCYRKHYGKVHTFQSGTGEYLAGLKQLGIKRGIATNRIREFFDYEIQMVDDGEWAGLIDTTACADDVTHYKPDPEIIHCALTRIGQTADPHSWYVGDSALDVLTAKNAGITAIFYNGGGWTQDYLDSVFKPSIEKAGNQQPDAIVGSLEDLFDLLAAIQLRTPSAFNCPVSRARPAAFPPHSPPPQRLEPDWHPAVAQISPPKTILFDWHATLVDTLDAMYHAVDDMLPELQQLGILDCLADPTLSRSREDARLIEYVQSHSQLHPKIKADRKISRTDIFEVLFADDQAAKQTAHKVFNHHYRKHYGTVLPFEPQVKNLLKGLRDLPLATGVITNRDREFFEHELKAVEDGSWVGLFDHHVSGDDTPRRKPHPDQLLKAAKDLGQPPAADIWYVGDSTTDIIAAKRAGMTAVFFNGAQWDLDWLQRLFPGNDRYPHQPDVVVNDFSEFWALVLACLHK